MEEIIKLDNVEAYNQMFGLKSLHPLISIVDLKEATRFPMHVTMNYGVYALFLKQTRGGDIRYGRQTYDYQEGTVTSFAPGQVVEVQLEDQPQAQGLLFHPDLIRGTALGREIRHYSFFSYSSSEALHLSDTEKGIFTDCLNKIRMEVERPADRNSKRLIVRNIELLLDYCLRFYERQFNTRTAVNKNVLNKFEDGAVVDALALKNAGIVKNPKDGIKVLGDGAMTKKLTVKAAKFSKTAVEKIEANGGKAEVI